MTVPVLYNQKVQVSQRQRNKHVYKVFLLFVNVLLCLHTLQSNCNLKMVYTYTIMRFCAFFFFLLLYRHFLPLLHSAR